MALLHYDLVSDPAATRWMLLTHGIFGSGGNWRGIAREVVRQAPTWGIALVDLRWHGRSGPRPDPQTLAACAEDVRALEAALRADGREVRALAGHSFGGKVMLEARRQGALVGQYWDHVWVLDSTPSARPDGLVSTGAGRTLQMLTELGAHFPSRAAFVEAVVARGQAPALAQWLATNLEPNGDGYRNRLQPAMLELLLRDYFARDLWAAVEDPAGGLVHLMIAGRSDTLSVDDKARAAALAAECPHVRVADVPAADHWLHVDAPAAVVQHFVDGLSP